MARPTDLTPEVQKIICDALALGSPIAAACDDAGIDDSTYYDWRQRGQSEPGIFAEFREATARARRQGRMALVADIRKAGKKDWKASAWLLERGHREHFGRVDRTEITGPDGGSLQVSGIFSGASDALLTTLAEKLGVEIPKEEVDAQRERVT